MYGIYCFINNLNGKRYIGQSKNLENRLNQHYTRSFNPKSNEYNTYFHRALRKYGKDTFTYQIIEDYYDDPGQDYLDARERFFIKKWDTTNRDKGYNISSDGIMNNQDYSFDYCCSIFKLLTKKEVLFIQEQLQ